MNEQTKAAKPSSFWIMPFLAVFLTVGTFALAVLLFFDAPSNQGALQTLDVAFGSIMTSFISMVSHYFGRTPPGEN